MSRSLYSFWLLGMASTFAIGNTFIEACGTSPEIVRLTRSYQSKFFLSYSPDGSRLTYSRHHPNRRGSEQVLMGLRIVNADGTNDRPFLSPFDRDVQIQEHAAWAPDGQKLAITGGGNDTGNASKDIFICDIENWTPKNLRKLVPGPSVNVGEQACWSPGGKQMVVATTSASLWLIDSNGRNRRLLTQQPGNYVLQPAWSPDGETIAFACDRDGNCEIYTIRVDGTELTRLTNHPGIDCRPKWSPDGQWIAFVSNRSGNNDIYVMRPDGTGLRNLTQHPAHDDHPAWSPDGRYLAFVSMRDGGFDIYRMTVPMDLKVGSRPPPASSHPRRLRTQRLDGLVAWYDFHEGQGALTGDRVGGISARLHEARWVKGAKSSSLTFDGKSAYLDCGNPIAYQLTGPLTIVAWVKINASQQNHYLVAKHGWNIYVGPDNVPRFETRTAGDNGWDTLTATQPVRVGQWAFLAAIFDTRTQKMEIYVDGKLAGTKPRTDGGIGAIGPFPLEIGRYGPSRSQHLNGVVAEFRLYDRALAAGEIKARYEEDKRKVE